VVDARKIIKVFNPDVVVGVGGYASGPAMAAAIMMHIPTLAFEPNYVPGFANKIVGHRVSAAAVHFEQTEKYFHNAQVVGVPVRAEFFNVPALHQSGHGGRCPGSTRANSSPPDHPPDGRA
jgi:UDP-N-acetylglucosamine--N-acetylmuramyl-(pentapeptide) pyrophosphoryl-undecaprenol N-acetylglucosamine transferase